MILPTIADIEKAHERIRPFVHRTPVVTCRTLNALAEAELFMKAENFQKVGAFKYRGATNAVQSLSDAEAAAGVGTHSSGNHAHARALAARERDIPAYIVMPRNAPRAKLAAVEGYGGRITPCESQLESREETLATVLQETGAHFVHPFDDARVIAGQGTAALELLEDVPDLDAIVTPVGGGGLLSGTAIVAAASAGRQRPLRVIAGEPELADDAFQSLRAGRIVPPRPPRTVADGLLTCLSDLTFAIVREHVEEIVLVSESEICQAMRWLWERAKLVVEPSGAVPLAAVISARAKLRGLRIGLILSGGNVDLSVENLSRYWD